MEGYTEVIFYVKTEDVPRYLQGLAGHYGYDVDVSPNDPNPESKAHYVRRKIRQEWIDRVRRYELREAKKLIDITPVDVQDAGA